jgi:two-component system chemotaxis response regulator CheB
MKSPQLKVGDRIRVLIVDDSVVVRRMVTNALEQDPVIEVVGTAANGKMGLERILRLKPDLVVLDVEMPDMNGLDVLRALSAMRSDVRVIMFSTLTERGASVTVEALSLGADDYVTKVSNEGSIEQSRSRLQQELIPRIKQFFQVARPAAAELPPSQARPVAVGRLRPEIMKATPRAVLIGSSTGGPAALSTVLQSLPEDFPLPILIVQHMPPFFTQLLAERLNQVCKLEVQEAREGATVHTGKVLLAPGDFHMKLARRNGEIAVTMDQGPQENFCRPAVDVLFRSAKDVYGGSAVGVILTGMGQDGLRGAEALRSLGATIIAQDEPSSVVWGMPGAVANAGLAHSVLPLPEIGPAVMKIVGRA